MLLNARREVLKAMNARREVLKATDMLCHTTLLMQPDDSQRASGYAPLQAKVAD